MIKSIIIDDEPLAHRIIERYVVDVPFLQVVGHCYFATEAYSLLQGKEIDLIFLDIEMPKLRGLDFLRSLQSRPQVILTTAYEEYAIDGFDLQVTDYLLKPFSFDRFLQALNRVQTNLLPSEAAASTSNPDIFIKVGRKHVKILIENIYCLESYGNYVKVWLKDEMLLTARTLTSFETELAGHTIARVHKSFLIQRRHLGFVEGSRIHLTNGMEVPIGKSHLTTVRSWL